MAAAGEYEMLIYDSEQRAGSRVYTTPIDNPANIRRYKDQTKDTLRAIIMPLRSSACKGNVREGYISDAIGKNDFVLAMYKGVKLVEPAMRITRRATKAPEPIEVPNAVGFVLARRDPEGSANFYIDVICSSEAGTLLLQYFHAFARARGATSITLSSLPSVLAYYTKYGYQFRKSCDPSDGVIQLPESITTYLRQLRETGQKPPVTTTNVYEIAPYMDFMEELHAHGFGVKKEGDCGKEHITKDEIKSKDCGSDGYTMIKCDLGAMGGKHRARRTHNNRRKRRTTRRRSHRH
jgi:hypothetical protein